MNKIAALVIGAIGLGVLVLVMAPLLGTLLGALTGWIVGWFFSETVLGFLAMLGIKGMVMWEIGAALGFVGGFFKSLTITKSSK